MRLIGFNVSDKNIDVDKVSAIPPVDFQHTLITGATGNGKTASLILPILADRIEKNHCIIFFDHKGHEHKKVKFLAKKFGRLDDIIEIGKPHAAQINLFAELDIIRLKEMIKTNNMSKDPYWTNSAANILEDITLSYRILNDIAIQLEQYDVMWENVREVFGELILYGINIFKTPAFSDIALIVSSAKSYKKFFKIIKDIPYKLERLFKDDYFAHDEIENKMILLAKVLQLNKNIESAKRFSLSDEKSDVNTGNNAVLQTLDNAIATYAKRDYMNNSEYTIQKLMETNAIVVIDTQSFGEDVMKVFFESILKKAVMRLRNSSNTALSVFIDESNRVISSSIDLHNDVLREASVELVLAIQNNEQMIIKFGKIEWKAIKKNIKHNYSISKDHQITYNEENTISSDPVLIQNKLLDDIDYDYFMIDKNRQRIKKAFIGTCDNLPTRFSVIYDLDLFDRTSEVILEDEQGNKNTYSYFGESILLKVKNSFPDIKTLITYPKKEDDDIEDFLDEDDYEIMDLEGIEEELDIGYLP